MSKEKYMHFYIHILGQHSLKATYDKIAQIILKEITGSESWEETMQLMTRSCIVLTSPLRASVVSDAGSDTSEHCEPACYPQTKTWKEMTANTLQEVSKCLLYF